MWRGDWEGRRARGGEPGLVWGLTHGERSGQLLKEKVGTDADAGGGEECVLAVTFAAGLSSGSWTSKAQGRLVSALLLLYPQKQ